MIAMFFGGDFVMNNVLGKLSDKIFKTKVMDGNSLKSFKDIEKLTGKTLNKSKKAGLVIYWTSMVANCMLLGFGLPAILNRMLENNIQKENALKQKNLNFINNERTPDVFKKFLIKN